MFFEDYQILKIPNARGTKTKSITNSINESNTTVIIKAFSGVVRCVKSEFFIISDVLVTQFTIYILHNI